MTTKNQEQIERAWEGWQKYNVLYKEKIFFVHAPKTGGRSVTAALPRKQTPHGNEARRWAYHCPASYVYERDPKFRDYGSFMTVRSPYDRLCSLFYWYKAKKYGAVALCDTFEEFVLRLPRLPIKAVFGQNPARGELGYQFQPQTWWAAANTVHLKMENLNTECTTYFKKVCKVKKPKIPHIGQFRRTSGYKRSKTGKTRRIEPKWNQDMLEIVNDIYASDFERFEYKLKHSKGKNK